MEGPLGESISPFTVVVPDELSSALTSGGLEIVEEVRPGEKAKRYLLVLDEEERRERRKTRREMFGSGIASKDPIIKADDEYLEGLAAARATLLSNQRLREGYLFDSKDPAVWADASAIFEAVNIESYCLEASGSDDVADALREAAKTHANECLYPGRYDLTPSSVSGDFLLLDAQPSPASDRPGRPWETVAPSRSAPRAPIEKALYQANVALKKHTFADAIALRVTAATNARIAEVLGKLCGDVGASFNGFSDLVKLQVTRGSATSGGDCLLSAAALSGRFSVTPTKFLAGMVAEQALTGRLRLRSGLFMSPVVVSEFAVVTCRTSAGDGMPSGSSSSGTVSFTTLESLRDSDPAEVDQLLRDRSLGRKLKPLMEGGCVAITRISGVQPAAAARLCASPLAASVEVSTVDVTARVSVHFVSAPQNVYMILHGPRFAEPFPPVQAVRRALSDRLLDLENIVIKRSREEDAQDGGEVSDGTMVSSHQSVDEVLADLQHTVYDILAKSPCALVEILAHPLMTHYHKHPALRSVEASTRKALQSIAEYRGKKYFLKT